MKRVLVIGSPGAGKSTLATRLAALTGLPLVHLDQEHWSAGWVEPEPVTFRDKMAAIIARPRWIIDGNYGATIEQRLARADTVIHLDFPAWLCVARIVKRVLGSYGQVRPDMAEGCPERFDLEFLLYTARFSSGPGPRTKRKLEGFGGTYVRLARPADARRFLAGLGSPE